MRGVEGVAFHGRESFILQKRTVQIKVKTKFSTQVSKAMLLQYQYRYLSVNPARVMQKSEARDITKSALYVKRESG